MKNKKITINNRCLLIAALFASQLSAQDTRGGNPFVIGERLWGWADLHAHPMSHLAFGADANGENGMFWGKPGGHWYSGYADLDKDNPSCTFKHGGFDADFVRHETHKALMGNLDSLTEYYHLGQDDGPPVNHGGNTYQQWPHARSVTHQQMHITQIRRAYEGGQRLMIASTTDNEFLADMWTKIGFNWTGNPIPAVDPDFGFDSARRQLKAIKQMVYLNPDWMEIALTSADAARIIKANKMAIILAVEMDSLTPAQILKLVKEDGVRQVIPVHLVNNDIGGAAVYTDAFNAVNNFLHSERDEFQHVLYDGFMKVLYDPLIAFRFGVPSIPHVAGVGAIDLQPVPPAEFAKLGYDDPEAIGGHRNLLGLTSEGKTFIKELAQRGVIIDLAHMSQNAMTDTLDLVQDWDYPVMDSHTGFRAADDTAFSERDLRRGDAAVISKLGGVIGLGTDWHEGFKRLFYRKAKDENSSIFYLSLRRAGYPDSQSYSLPALPGNPVLTHLLIRMNTFDTVQYAGLSKYNKYLAILTIDGKTHTYEIRKRPEGWRHGMMNVFPIELPFQTYSNKLTKVTFRIEGDSLDDFAVQELEIKAVPQGDDPVATWLDSYKEALTMMGGRGMAIGTDINGFAPQIWLSAQDAHLPIDVAKRFGNVNAKSLVSSQMGSKTFHFKNDGIAHYGMLPDFLQVVSQQPESTKALDALFHSANDVVWMWGKCERMGKKIQ